MQLERPRQKNSCTRAPLVQRITRANRNTEIDGKKLCAIRAVNLTCYTLKTTFSQQCK